MHKDATVCSFRCTICSFRCHVAMVTDHDLQVGIGEQEFPNHNAGALRVLYGSDP